MSTPVFAPRQRVSASSIKALTSCSLAYYYSRVLRMPEKVWSRTVIGTMLHSLFDCLRNPRHRRHYDLITAPGISVEYKLSPVVARFMRKWQRLHNITDELMADVNGMLYVGLLLIDFHFTSADKSWPPEHEFNLVLDDGTHIRGFIDGLAEKDGIMIIRDFKSARNRFTAKEMNDSIQAYIYQLYCWKEFGKAARVEFVMLRHPPTKRTPTKHLQIVDPSSPAQLAGLERYIKDVSKTVNNFTLEEAYTSPCEDEGFCRHVCSYYAPFKYWAVAKKADPTQTPIHTFALDKPPLLIQNDEVLIPLEHQGCPIRYQGLSIP